MSFIFIYNKYFFYYHRPAPHRQQRPTHRLRRHVEMLQHARGCTAVSIFVFATNTLAYQKKNARHVAARARDIDLRPSVPSVGGAPSLCSESNLSRLFGTIIRGAHAVPRSRVCLRVPRGAHSRSHSIAFSGRMLRERLRHRAVECALFSQQFLKVRTRSSHLPGTDALEGSSMAVLGRVPPRRPRLVASESPPARSGASRENMVRRPVCLEIAGPVVLYYDFFVKEKGTFFI